MSQNTQMRREKLFSKDGFYSRVLDSNALLHREAITQGRHVVARFLSNFSTKSRHEQPVKVLDLACGGVPVSITAIMAAFPEYHFHYTGIDINPDQISTAQNEFVFPDNVSNIKFIEGNAWAPCTTSLSEQYDIVYMGMNLHHGTPEEIFFLASQLAKLIKSDGIFINHDWFRPNEQPYQRRPDCNPDNPTESFRLLESSLLSSIAIPALTSREVSFNDPQSNWREIYNKGLRQALIDKGAGIECAESTYQHVKQRDYPISASEFIAIFEQNGFKCKVLHYGNSDPLMDYIFMPVATKSTSLLTTLQV